LAIHPLHLHAHAMNRHAYAHRAATSVATGAFAWSMRREHGLGGIAAPRPLH
jgi:hypothetical protein